MKLFRWLDRNILLVATLLLLAFIPLYPKVPLIDIKQTWVYIRMDDFIVAFAVLFYFIELYRKKATWKTPLTYAILAFWLTGFLSTVLGVIFIFPRLSYVFPHIAFLYYARHIEYLSVFFIAYSAIKEKKHLAYVTIALVLIFVAVIGYGFGQRFVPCMFPAFSTMSEEFAKGQPLCLRASDRLESTFAGHYDLAAYLVMTIPIIGSLSFGYKRWRQRGTLLILAVLGVITLLMTASRTSFVMYLCAVFIMLVLQKQKKWIIPVTLVSILLLFSFQGLYARYLSTVSKQQVAYNDKGEKLGLVSYTKDHRMIIDKQTPIGQQPPPSTQTITNGQHIATQSGITIQETNASDSSKTVTQIEGTITIKEQQTLDTSISTRLQAEWPNALRAFMRNPLLGSGYSSITLATDGNYFRILGETGLLGLITFFLIIALYMKYILNAMKSIDSPVTKSLLIGILSGICGLLLNALLIDVFEASKIAYILWLLIGVSLSIIRFRKHPIP